MQVEVAHGLLGRSAVGLQHGDAFGVECALDGVRHALCGLHDGTGFFGGQLEQRHLAGAERDAGVVGERAGDAEPARGQFVSRRFVPPSA